SPTASQAPIRRGNRTSLLLTCLPLLAACTVTAGVQGVQCLARASSRARALPATADPRLGTLTQSQAARMANTLCARIAGSPARPLAAAGYPNGPGALVRQGSEWQVHCRVSGTGETGDGSYFLRLDADRGEVVVIQREKPADAATAAAVATAPVP